jgi:4-amino-4-deoxy-L-arabinose transferase-like glycosyltransferase
MAWQAGYYKHPPFAAWVSAAWFSFMPKRNWAFFLLAAVNCSLALAAVRLIALRFLKPGEVMVAVLAMTLIPFYFVDAYKYNPNVAMLPLWPLTAWCYLRVLRNGRWIDAVYLGGAAGLAMLAKYYSAFLLAALLGHALTDPVARRLFRSRTFYIALAVFAACVSPHVYWLFKTHFMILEYLSTRVAVGSGIPHLFGEKFAEFTFAPLAYTLIPIGLVYLFSRLYPATPQRKLVERWKTLADSVEGRALLWMSVAPVALTIVYCTVMSDVMHTTWLIPAGFGWTILAVRLLPDWDSGRARRPFLRLLGLFWAILIVGALLLPSRTGPPMIEAAELALKAWHQRYPVPLRIVGGFRDYSNALAFYSPDSPQVLQENNYRLTPWVSPEDVRRYGALFVCDSRIASCMQQVRQLKPAPRLVKSVSIRHAGASADGERFPISIFMIPPGRAA